MLKKSRIKSQQEKTTIDLDITVSKEIKNIAKIKGISFAELINQILTHFIKNFKAINKSKGKLDESDDEKYLEYLDSLRELLSDSGIPQKSKKYLIG